MADFDPSSPSGPNPGFAAGKNLETQNFREGGLVPRCGGWRFDRAAGSGLLGERWQASNPFSRKTRVFEFFPREKATPLSSLDLAREWFRQRSHELPVEINLDAEPAWLAFDMAAPAPEAEPQAPFAWEVQASAQPAASKSPDPLELAETPIPVKIADNPPAPAVADFLPAVPATPPPQRKAEKPRDPRPRRERESKTQPAKRHDQKPSPAKRDLEKRVSPPIQPHSMAVPPPFPVQAPSTARGATPPPVPTPPDQALPPIPTSVVLDSAGLIGYFRAFVARHGGRPPTQGPEFVALLKELQSRGVVEGWSEATCRASLEVHRDQFLNFDDKLWIWARHEDTRDAYRHYLAHAIVGRERASAERSLERLAQRSKSRRPQNTVKPGRSGKAVWFSAIAAVGVFAGAYMIQFVNKNERPTVPPTASKPISKPTTKPSIATPAKPSNERPPEEVRVKNAYGMDMILVRKGQYQRGSPAQERDRDEDELQHTVTLTRDFYLAKTEVTRGHWATVMDSGQRPQVSGVPADATLPKTDISWSEAIEFCNRLSAMEDLKPAYRANFEIDPSANGYRLPTEAEWEYACRAGSDSPPVLRQVAWYSGNSSQSLRPVAGLAPNAWGFYDMQGNAAEWCQDGYAPYPKTDVVDPLGRSDSGSKVKRGGSGKDPAYICRIANRVAAANARDRWTGFRVMLPVR